MRGAFLSTSERQDHVATNRNTVLTADKCAQRIKGLNEHVTAKTALTINQQPMKLVDVIAVYQAALDARATLKSKRAEVKLALQGWKEADVTQETVDRGLKVWVQLTYGLQSQEAQDMGFAAPKRGKANLDTKQKAQLQARATREARGTKGKKQKAKIKGTVATPTAPAAPAPTAPAAPATNGVAAPAATNGIAASH